MTKRVIRDYFAAFRWKKIKERYSNYNTWYIIYFLVLTPLWLHAERMPGGFLTYYLINVPILFCIISAGLHPMVLPKILYLCPMSKESRKEYIIKSCYVRIAIPVTMGIAGSVVLMCRGFCSRLYGAVIIMNIVILSIVLGADTSAQGYGKIAENGQRTLDFDSREGVCQGIVTIVAMLIGLGYQMLVQWESFLNLMGGVVLGIVLVVELPLTILFLKDWKKRVEQLLFYENTGVLQKK